MSTTQATRDAFDYEHGGIATEAEATTIAEWLQSRRIGARIEDSGDLFRVWVPRIGGYFWPLDATEDSWNTAV